ncbi:MAG: hypothetical protein H0V22_12000 [Solirubrobacterales bacterium]|jgi:hypothetical protein|nr:hypothetical protein [Solirubrobacterales bacterium]
MPELLSEKVRATTLKMTRVMFPHDDLPDEAYDKVVRQLEADAHGDESVLATIELGVTQLDDPRPFSELEADAQLEILKRSEAAESPFFKLVHATAVVELYDNPLVWKAFGYEGPAVHLGGYVDRGFDDLAWLPDPPLLSPEYAKTIQEA